MRTFNSPPYLGEEGTEQFTINYEVGGRQLSSQKLHDPFVTATVVLCWMDLLRGMLRGHLRVRVTVTGTQAVQRRIMTMNPYKLQAEQAEWEAECAARAAAGGYLAGDGCSTVGTVGHG